MVQSTTLPADICIIFDMDGTLVDSETLCNQAYLDLVPDIGLTLEAMVREHSGRRLAHIVADIEERVGRKLPVSFETDYRAHVAALFDTHLKPVPGVPEMLAALEFPKCVASNAPRRKISHAMQVSGLAEHFTGAIFSAYDIDAWKPDPGVFLHAAREMGYPREACIVVEDSPTGVEAADRAGMKVFQYLPRRDMSATGKATGFHHMDDLAPKITAHLASVSQRR